MKKTNQQPSKVPKIFMIIAGIWLVYIFIKLTAETGMLPSNFVKKIRYFSELFYPDDPLGIILSSLIVLYGVIVIFVVFGRKRTTGENKTINRSIWIFATCVILGLIIAAIAMYA